MNVVGVLFSELISVPQRLFGQPRIASKRYKYTFNSCYAEHFVSSVAIIWSSLKSSSFFGRYGLNIFVLKYLLIHNGFFFITCESANFVLV